MTRRLGPNRLSRFVLVRADNPHEPAVIGLCVTPCPAQASVNARLPTCCRSRSSTDTAVIPEGRLAERASRLLLGDKILHGLKQHILL